MRKIFLWILLMIVSINVVSASLFFIGDRTQEDYCQIETISTDTYEQLRPLYSIDDFINDTYQEMISNNFSEDILITVPVFNEDNLRIFFTNEFEDNSLRFGTASGNRLTIYIKAIHNYGTSLSWTEKMILNKIKNTYFHEVSHYLDLERNLYGNESNTAKLFKINGTRDNVNNLNYFVEIYNQTFQSPNVPVELRDTVKYDELFTSPTAPYDENKFFNEIVARTSALCLYEVNNQKYEFNNTNNYFYCNNNFNISNKYTQKYEEIINYNLITWFYNEFPQNRTIITSLDGLCSTQENIPKIFQIIETLIEEFTNFLSNNYLMLIAILLTINLIIAIILIVKISIKNNLKKLK